jgi:hypothetical protein
MVDVESLSDSDDEQVTNESGLQGIRHEDSVRQEEVKRHNEPLQGFETVRPLSPLPPISSHSDEFMDDNVSIGSPHRTEEEIVTPRTQPRSHVDEIIEEVVNAPYDHVLVTDGQSILDSSNEEELMPANENNSEAESETEPVRRTFAGRYPDRDRREPDRFMHPKYHLREGKVVYDPPSTSGNSSLSRSSYGSSQYRSRVAVTRKGSSEEFAYSARLPVITSIQAFNGCMIGCASASTGIMSGKKEFGYRGGYIGHSSSTRSSSGSRAGRSTSTGSR